jgi:hypothetical protein
LAYASLVSFSAASGGAYRQQLTTTALGVVDGAHGPCIASRGAGGAVLDTGGAELGAGVAALGAGVAAPGAGVAAPGKGIAARGAGVDALGTGTLGAGVAALGAGVGPLDVGIATWGAGVDAFGAGVDAFGAGVDALLGLVPAEEAGTPAALEIGAVLATEVWVGVGEGDDVGVELDGAAPGASSRGSGQPCNSSIPRHTAAPTPRKPSRPKRSESVRRTERSGAFAMTSERIRFVDVLSSTATAAARP